MMFALLIVVFLTFTLLAFITVSSPSHATKMYCDSLPIVKAVLSVSLTSYCEANLSSLFAFSCYGLKSNY